MSDATTVVLAASAPAALAASAGMPAQGVIACAIVGAVIGVWVSRPHDVALTGRQVFVAVGQVAGYSAAAVLVSAAWDAVAPAYAASGGALAPLARVPSWVVAGAMALGGFWVLPVLAGWIKRRADK